MSKVKKELPPIVVKKDGVDVELIVKTPTLKEANAAQKTYNTAIHDALESKSFLRAKLDDFMKEQGIWDESKQAERTKLQAEVLDLEQKLNEGGMKLSEGKGLALDIIKARTKLRNLVGDRSQLDNLTAEGQADNAKFNYLVSACLVYKSNGQPYYANVEDYLEHSTDDEASEAANRLASMMYGLDDDYEAKLPEFRFLKEFGMVNDKLRLINSEGKLVDEDGRLVNEDGRFINEQNEFVDKKGRLVDEDGNLIINRKPFLDEDGQEIKVKQEEPVPVKEEVAVEKETPTEELVSKE
jgi:hypothetical protein